MKTKEFVAIGKKLLPSLPNFDLKGSLMFVRPVGEVLKGIHFEGSDFDKTSFYVNFFCSAFQKRTSISYSATASESTAAIDGIRAITT